MTKHHLKTFCSLKYNNHANSLKVELPFKLLTVGSKIIRGFEIIRVKKTHTKSVL